MAANVSTPPLYRSCVVAVKITCGWGSIPAPRAGSVCPHPLPSLPPSLSPSYMSGSMQLMDRGPDGLNLVGTDAYEGSLLEDGPPGGVTVGPWTAVPMSVLRTLQVSRAWRLCTVRCHC
jgi:hypothetical protein